MLVTEVANVVVTNNNNCERDKESQNDRDNKCASH